MQFKCLDCGACEGYLEKCNPPMWVLFKENIKVQAETIVTCSKCKESFVNIVSMKSNSGEDIVFSCGAEGFNFSEIKKEVKNAG